MPRHLPPLVCPVAGDVIEPISPMDGPSRADGHVPARITRSQPAKFSPKKPITCDLWLLVFSHPFQSSLTVGPRETFLPVWGSGFNQMYRTAPPVFSHSPPSLNMQWTRLD